MKRKTEDKVSILSSQGIHHVINVDRHLEMMGLSGEMRRLPRAFNDHGAGTSGNKTRR